MPEQAKIYYISLPDEMRKEDKLTWLRETKFKDISFERITPDAKHNWINLSDTDFDSLLPLIDKEIKAGKSKESIFDFSSLGVLTNRDDWVYDFDKKQLESKALMLEKVFNESVANNLMDFSIKWSSSLEAYFKSKLIAKYNKKHIKQTSYRPFVKMFHYTEKLFNHRLTSNHYKLLGEHLDKENTSIAFTTIASTKDFFVLTTDVLADGHFTGDSQCLPQYTYANNERIENITDWALQKFQEKYASKSEPSAVAAGLTPDKQNLESTNQHQPLATANGSDNYNITKQDIFHYVYAVLHNPQYRQKYELNLKREFPRIPFYDDFYQWATWGKALMDLHINYETQKPYGLTENGKRIMENKEGVTESVKRIMENEEKITENADNSDNFPLSTFRFPFTAVPKTKLKADKTNNTIEIDSITTLEGIPPIAWEYKLGNRSALEWILDQYKERKPQDATIAEKFNTYKFADYKNDVINLLQKVCAVSVETQKIIEEMKEKG